MALPLSAEEHAGKAETDRGQTREGDGDLKKFTFHRLPSSPVHLAQDTGEF
jgi:hypothetical protein